MVIDGTMPRTRQEEVVLHEFVHQAIPDMPEGIVRAIGEGLYGILKQNRLLQPDFLERVSDGIATPEEVQQVEQVNQQMIDEPFIFLRKEVSELPWDGGPVFDDEGNLSIVDEAGRVNRNAAHLAVARLTGARGGVKLSKHKRRAAARELKDLYKTSLEERLPVNIIQLAG